MYSIYTHQTIPNTTTLTHFSPTINAENLYIQKICAMLLVLELELGCMNLTPHH